MPDQDASTAPDTSKPERAARGSTGGSGARSADQGTNSPQDTPPSATVFAQLRTRRNRYMVATRNIPGFQPLSMDSVMNVLNDSPDIEVVKRIQAPTILGLQATGSGVAEVIVANMEPGKASLLEASSRGSVLVEDDTPLSYSLLPELSVAAVNPGVFVPASTGFSAMFQVNGPDGPLADVEVQLYGSLFPAKGRTDAQGRVTLELPGEEPGALRALYVKPRADHWDFWLRNPDISSSSVNPVQLKRLPILLNGSDPWKGWGDKVMGIDRLPDSFDGKGVRVAVIDSGAAQSTHRNLGLVGPGLSVIGGDPNAWGDDVIGHGSHCSGIIGGVRGAGQNGLRGLAPKAEMHEVRVFPGGRFSDLVEALDYCISHDIDIVSMSLGGGSPSQILADRIQQARMQGIACIVAAGNSAGPVQFPAVLGTTLAVAAIGKLGEFPDDSFHSQQTAEGVTPFKDIFPAAFSCFGPEIDLCAPGVAIISSVPPDGFASWDGTSMATPHVSGLAALVLAHHPDFKSSFSQRNEARVQHLFDILKSSCQQLPFGREKVGLGLPWAPKALGVETLQAPEAMRSIPPESMAALLKLIQLLKAS